MVEQQVMEALIQIQRASSIPKSISFIEKINAIQYHKEIYTNILQSTQ